MGDFANFDPPEFHGGADRQSADIARHIGFKQALLFKGTPGAEGQDARDEQTDSEQGEQAEFEIVRFYAHGFRWVEQNGRGRPHG